MIELEKKINVKALILSLALALVTCLLLISYINGIKKPAPVEEKVKLLVASRNIEPGTLISNQDVNAIDISADSMPAGVLNDRKEIEGMYADQPIIAGEPFKGERLKTKEELSLSWNIPESMRALTIFINEDGIFSNLLRVGDHVDVVGSFTSDAGGNSSVSSSMIIVQNVEVLAIGSDRMGNADTQTTTDKLPATVTLALTPADAEKIVYSKDFGQFSLILRGNGDNEKTNTLGTIQDDLVPPRILQFKNIISKPQQETPK